MIAIKNKYIIFLSLFFSLFIMSCKDKWEEHDTIQDPKLAINLLTLIKQNPDLTQFATYLNKTGYDKVIASSKTFTIWAPTNLAMTSMDQSVLNDSVKLRQFIANHISDQSYLTNMAKPSLTIRTLNGKNIIFTKTKFEEATIIKADTYFGNGVLHTVDKAIVPKPNVWEYLNSTPVSIQQTYLQSLNYQKVDSTLATVIGIDPKTGNPIYKPGTGIVNKNYFFQKATDLSNEDIKYTYVILTDAAFTTEKTKLSKYYAIVNNNATPARNAFVSDSLINWAIVKDLVFNGDYSSNLPDSIMSNDSVRVHLDPNAIVETHKVSNGVVYVMNRIDYKMSGKIKPVIIQGINIAGSYGSQGTHSTLTRRNPNTGLIYSELYYSATGISSYWIKYQPTLTSTTYHVYWNAVRDFNTTGTIVYFSQRVGFGTTALLPAFPYKQVDLLNYNDVYLGDYTVTSAGKLDTFLVGAANTTSGQNSIVLNYLKLVPVTN